MLVKAADQGKREYCIAVFNRLLNANNICPANHDTDYNYGWYCCDGDKSQRPVLTREAEKEMANPAVCVGYSQSWNTYLIMDNPDYLADE